MNEVSWGGGSTPSPLKSCYREYTVMTFFRFHPRYEDKVMLLVFLAPVIMLFLFLCYLVIQNIILSFSNYHYLIGRRQFVGINNYRTVLTTKAFWDALRINVILTVTTVVGQLLLGLGAALLIRRSSRLTVILRSIFLIPYVLPVIVTALIWRWLFVDGYGLISYILERIGILPAGGSPLSNPTLALPAVILVNIWRGFPFAMVMYLAALQQIPQSEYEAAKVDGANGVQLFRWITLPHLKSITITLLILRTIWVFNWFDLVYLLTGGGPAGKTQHLPLLVYIAGMGQYQFGYASATAVLMSLGVLLLLVPILLLWRKTEEVQV